MLEGYDIICFSNDWNGDPLSKKHIVRRLAARNRVLWVNSIGNRNPTASVRDARRIASKLWQYLRGRQVAGKNIHLFSPLAIPFHGSQTARRFNREFLAWSLARACRDLGFRKRVTWTFLPSAADLAGTLGEELIIYHCVDEFSEFSGTNKAAILEMERRLIEKADIVIVSSEPLYRAKSHLNPNTFLVTHGVEVEFFRTACRPETAIPADLVALPRPVIGFFGLIADWVDLDLVRFLAVSRPQWSFALIGKCDTDVSVLSGLRNVHLLGRKDYALLPGYCKGFDVAILPFAVNALTVAANPLKLREYLAAGLPVVSTDIPEAVRLEGLLRIGRSYDGFLREIQMLVDRGQTGPHLPVSRTMDPESWDEKVEELSRIIHAFRSGARRSVARAA